MAFQKIIQVDAFIINLLKMRWWLYACMILVLVLVIQPKYFWRLNSK